MAKVHTIRFGCGNPERPFSGVWRLIFNRDDVFLGVSKDAMGIFKISLHKSGVWVLAATKQSGATFTGNRRAKRWTRPLEHAHGITRGPSIFIPHTSLGSRPLLPDDAKKNVVWFTSPAAGHAVEFSLYFVAPDATTRWDSDQTTLAEHRLSSGDRVILLASSRPMTADFTATVEKLLHDNVLRMDDPSGFRGGSFLWFTESRDTLRVPIIVDLPVPIGPAHPPFLSR